MSEDKKMTTKEAIYQIKDIVEDIKTCIFTTNLESVPLNARPMYAKEVDEDGAIWFFLIRRGDHFRDIVKDNRVQLFFSSPEKSEFLSAYGVAKIEVDQEKREELWSSFDEAYFDGPEDQNLVLTKVEVEDAYYWDTKHGKAISLLKMATAAVTGKKQEIGKKGKISIHK